MVAKSKDPYKNRYRNRNDTAQPYLYAVGWTSLNKFYVGVRYAKACHPSELWNGYYTSSRYVKDLAREYGDPDYLDILGTYSTPQEAVDAEVEALEKFGLHLHPDFLNKSAGRAISFDAEVRARMSSIARARGPWSDERKAAHSVALKGRTQSAVTRAKMSETSKGRSKSPEHLAALSKSRKGKPWSESARQAQAHARASKKALRQQLQVSPDK